MTSSSSLDPTPPLTESSTPSSTRGPATPAPDASSSQIQRGGKVKGQAGGGGECTPAHVIYCFDVLVAHFEGRKPISPPFEDDQKMALFVTWNKQSARGSGRPALRGCIGNFSPMSLGKGLREYALISALEDHRFSPITESELPSLSCSVSLLTPTTPIDDPLDWTPGIHGIQISFPHPTTTSSSSHTSPSTRKLSATYLPEIATDQNWTREETIKSAIQKAGYRGRVEVGDTLWKSLKVGVYESRKCSLGFQEYRTWKEAGGSNARMNE